MALEPPGGRFRRSNSARTRGWSTLGRSESTILRKMAESDRPDVLHPQVLDTSDRPNRPPGASSAFQMLRKAAHLLRGFAIWQDRATYGVKMVLSLEHGELFSEMALWLTPNAGSGASPATHRPPAGDPPGGQQTDNRVRGGKIQPPLSFVPRTYPGATRPRGGPQPPHSDIVL